jgi:hypothetical protein
MWRRQVQSDDAGLIVTPVRSIIPSL